MEKLIELLSEYDAEDEWCLVRMEGRVRKFDERLIISKSYGFIKWLVDNDKIDRPEVWLKIKDLGDEYGWFGIYSGVHIECLLMLLAIQDEPIDYLTSVLK